MKVGEVIEKAMRKEIRWMDAARIIGVSDRQMRRWKARYETDGVDGLHDHREGKVPKNRVPEATMARVLELYRQEYAWFNVQHFWEQLGEHQIKVSYGWTKALLHDAGLERREAIRAGARSDPVGELLAVSLAAIDAAPQEPVRDSAKVASCCAGSAARHGRATLDSKQGLSFRRPRLCPSQPRELWWRVLHSRLVARRAPPVRGTSEAPWNPSSASSSVAHEHAACSPSCART